MTWFDHAACKGERTDSFFDSFELSNQEQREHVLQFCENCSVKQECQEYAESFPNTYGLWGGFYYKNGKKKNPLKIAILQNINELS